MTDFEFQNGTFHNENKPLTERQMRLIAPAIFASKCEEHLTETYTPVRTISVIRKICKLSDYRPYAVGMQRRKNVANARKADTAPHYIRFRRPQDMDMNVTPEILLMNSHDGTKRFRMYTGQIRWFCMNGLVSGTRYTDFHLKHIYEPKSMQEEILANIEGATKQLAEIQEQMIRWNQIRLSSDEIQEFVELAFPLRYSDEARAPLVASDLASNIRRAEDIGDDLWHVFNRIQENLLKGGQTRVVPMPRDGEPNRTRQVTAQSLRDPGKLLTLNRELWDIAEQFDPEIVF